MVEHNSDVYNPPYIYLFSLYTYMEEDLFRGVVYITVMFDHPSLVSLLFAVLVSLHPVTFLRFFITCIGKIRECSQVPNKTIHSRVATPVATRRS